MIWLKLLRPCFAFDCQQESSETFKCYGALRYQILGKGVMDVDVERGGHISRCSLWCDSLLNIMQDISGVTLNPKPLVIAVLGVGALHSSFRGCWVQSCPAMFSFERRPSCSWG